MSVRQGACVLALLAVSACAAPQRSSPSCAREVDRDPKVQALQMQMLGNIEGNGLNRSSLDALRREAMARCLRREAHGGAGGVASPPLQPGRF
ncbi:MAG: hypothetical protein ACRYG6_08350 [Janthinobacterium lividum]